MSDFINKTKAWFGKIQKRDSSYEKDGIRPKRDWEIILSFTTVLLIILAAVAGYFYMQVDQGKLFKVAADDVENEAKINKTLLDKTIGDINERRKSFETVMQGGIVSADPSL